MERRKLFKNSFNSMNSSNLSSFHLPTMTFGNSSVKSALRYRKINFFTIPAFPRFYLNDQRGIALVITLLTVVLVTAMVVEFSYGVYTGINNLYNWRDSQRLSIMAKSGINVAVRYLPMAIREPKYSTGAIEIPVENPFEDFTGIITIRIEDESSKFYLNSLVNARGQKNDSAYNAFIRLLRALSLDEKIADRSTDWIFKKWETGASGSEVRAKTSRILTADELLLIDGISGKDYDTLLPYVTVYGPMDNSLHININSAEKPVLRCLSDDITDALAQRVVDYRKDNPFIGPSDLSRVPGFGKDIGIPPGMVITDKGPFLIRAAASSGGVKRIIETVFNMSSGKIEYWKEY